MKLKTFEEKQKHVCTLEDVLELADKLFSLLVVADVFCSQICDCENGKSVRCMMKYVLKCADELYCELDRMLEH